MISLAVFTTNSSGRGKKLLRSRKFGGLWAGGIAENFWGNSLTASFTESKLTPSWLSPLRTPAADLGIGEVGEEQFQRGLRGRAGRGAEVMAFAYGFWQLLWNLSVEKDISAEAEVCAQPHGMSGGDFPLASQDHAAERK